jgi:hypothetical protein
MTKRGRTRRRTAASTSTTPEAQTEMFPGAPMGDARRAASNQPPAKSKPKPARKGLASLPWPGGDRK